MANCKISKIKLCLISALLLLFACESPSCPTCDRHGDTICTHSSDPTMDGLSPSQRRANELAHAKMVGATFVVFSATCFIVIGFVRRRRRGDEDLPVSH